MHCRRCRKYKPDTINPEFGLGDCSEEKQEVLMRSWEHGEYKWFYQKKMTYPGSEACSEYEEIPRPEDIDDTSARKGV